MYIVHEFQRDELIIVLQPSDLIFLLVLSLMLIKDFIVDYCNGKCTIIMVLPCNQK